MTPNDLLDALQAFIEGITKDLILEVYPITNRVPTANGEKRTEEKPKERAAEVYKMRLPSKDAETSRIPYVLLQLLTGDDTQEPGQEADSSCKLRVVCATYSADASKGSIDLLNLITRIRIGLLKQGVIGDVFTLRKPLEWACYPDDTGCYYLGEMITNWGLPTVTREVNLYGEE